jgi:hypothetical protein
MTDTSAAEWRLPEEPGQDVQAVRVVDTGQRWNRLTALVGHWIVDNPLVVPPPQVLSWPALLAHGRHLVAADHVSIAPIKPHQCVPEPKDVDRGE